MALSSFTQGYIHNSNISVTYYGVFWCELSAWSMRKWVKLQGVHIEIDESKRLCLDAHCTCTYGFVFLHLNISERLSYYIIYLIWINYIYDILATRLFCYLSVSFYSDPSKKDHTLKWLNIFVFVSSLEY